MNIKSYLSALYNLTFSILFGDLKTTSKAQIIKRKVGTDLSIILKI